MVRTPALDALGRASRDSPHPVCLPPTIGGAATTRTKHTRRATSPRSSQGRRLTSCWHSRRVTPCCCRSYGPDVPLGPRHAACTLSKAHVVGRVHLARAAAAPAHALTHAQDARAAAPESGADAEGAQPLWAVLLLLRWLTRFPVSQPGPRRRRPCGERSTATCSPTARQSRRACAGSVGVV